MPHERRWRSWCVVAGGLGLLLVSSCTLVGSSVDHFSAGGAASACPPGGEVCDGLCVDTQSSSAHCGGCGKTCNTGEACVAGQCTIACPGGQVACQNLCYALDNDPRHCGGCDVSCKAGEVCGDGKCGSTCPPEQTNCSGSCADLQTDAKHCGACGTVCGPNDECVEGKCVIACRTQLNQPITDPWGWSWDGLERAAAAYDAAQTTCSAFRGRLPTASELHRVSATQSATVGQTIHTNPLWSMAPGAPGHARVRLSDSNVSGVADTTPSNYRCVCPPPLPKVYTGNNCYGPVGSGCAALDEENKRHHLDKADRPALTKAGAIWECAFYGGHLATGLELTEAVQKGVGAGTGAWLHVADEVQPTQGALLRWTDGQGFLYQYTNGPNSLAFTDVSTPYAFRCVGENYNPGPSPATVTGAWNGPGFRKIEAADLPGSSFIEAVDDCFAKGGHLPTAAELGEQILQGLPGGSDAWLWTSDQTGHNGTNFTVSVRKWKDVEPLHTYGGAAMTWAYKHTNSYAHRCIYYPIDTTYNGPPAASCAGGCTALAVGNKGAKVWIDSFDRAPAAQAQVAIDTCRKLGGHLASERDLAEAIRKGLPNGTNAWLFTSDLMRGDQNGLLLGIVKWTGTMPAFTDLWQADMTWSWPYDARAYRCAWTNELR